MYEVGATLQKYILKIFDKVLKYLIYTTNIK